MNLHDRLLHDYTLVDSLETVTLWQRGAATTVAGVKAQPLEREAVQRLADSFGLESTFRSFSLPVAELGTIAPAQGDSLVDSGTQRWRVLSATLATVATRWVVTCIAAR